MKKDNDPTEQVQRRTTKLLSGLRTYDLRSLSRIEMTSNSGGRTCSDLELTEFVGIRAGYELLNRKYRKNHKELEKANARFTRSLEKLDALDGFGKATTFIDNVLNEVCGFKRKADEYFSEEMELVAACKRRIEHLKEQRVFIARFHRLLADHLFCLGHYRSALSLAKSSSAGCLCLTDIYEEAIVISEALLRGDTGPAHQWIQEANYKLKKSECFFEFDIRVFELYLLVKAGKRLEAIQHARKYLAGGLKPDDYQATKLGQAMLLLAMRTPEEVELKAAQNELNEQWICKRFHAAFTNFYSFSSLTPFSLAVKAGITAIKTHFCYSAKARHPDCVVCHPLINRLAFDLPFGNYDHSVLTCYQTGLLMNEENPPMALPNGYVYSEKVTYVSFSLLTHLNCLCNQSIIRYHVVLIGMSLCIRWRFGQLGLTLSISNLKLWLYVLVMG
ncbi:unnamed protein product [Dibothriocephalus latus]|uniref:CTLH domain-containing protein n=1 Tax=Dibothriocephalus latus TaxID=60516 RepID=A0A3P7NQR9_DIBLA|nr:unnamed protein product [Dibothriocephalus latus]